MPPLEPNQPKTAMWRSLEEAEGASSFRTAASKEFGAYDPQEMIEAPSRRRFLKLMGASMALAGSGMTGCRRWPEQDVVPHVSRPEGHMPGVPNRYATAYEVGGAARPMVVSSFDGRPVKIEGNPFYPDPERLPVQRRPPGSNGMSYSNGASNAWMQGSVLDLYDPDRSQTVRAVAEKTDKTWADFAPVAAAMGANGGAGLVVLSGATSSPTFAAMKAKFPAAKFYNWEPLNRDQEVEGTKRAFGKPLRARLHLNLAKVIVCLDADPIGTHPDALRNARKWAAGRTSVDRPGREMNRMYVAEPSVTISGANADVRLPMKASGIGQLALDIYTHLKEKTTPTKATFMAQVVSDLRANAGMGLIVAGPNQPADVHLLTHQINGLLGNLNKTITFIDETQVDLTGQISSLAQAMAAGSVKSLLILGGNPVYDAPADLKFAEALKKVKTSVHLSTYLDETSRRCTWHLPQSHYLESWGDARHYDGTLCIQQPLILPIYQEDSTKKQATHSAIELLEIVSGQAVADGHAAVRATHNAAANEKAWRRSLHDGFVKGSASKAVAVSAPTAAAPGVAKEIAGLEISFTTDSAIYDGRFANNGWLQELPDSMTRLTWDNALMVSFATAARLNLEQGDLIDLAVDKRQLTAAVYLMPWQADDAATISLGYGRDGAGHIAEGVGFDAYTVRTTAASGFAEVSEKTIKKIGDYELVSTQDHHLIDTIGFEERQDRIFGAAHHEPSGDKPELEAKEEPHEKPSAKKGGHAPHKARMGVLYRQDTLDSFVDHVDSSDKHDRDYIRKAGPHLPVMGHQVTQKTMPLQIFDSPIDFDKHPNRWGMAIDLTSCTGCGACVVACQAENNIPIVGKEQVAMGREMHWIRIDRYFESEVDGHGKPIKEKVISASHQPVTCHHCENAPCEQVCPVAATTHDSDGLNVMIYNRCIGTRYCSNNCHYKVRRFNFFDWHAKDPKGPPRSGTFLGIPDQQQLSTVNKVKQMVFNPDVTVRMRGVMEKCSFCIQRIKAATIPAKNKGERLADGAITPACGQACPTAAITFGDLHDPASRVSKKFDNDRSPRNYEMLEELNVRARIRYMARIDNPAGGNEAKS